MNDNKPQQDRLTHLEVAVTKLDANLDVVKNNHLVHLQQDVDRVENKIDKMDQRLWAIMFMIVALAVSNVLVGFFQ